MATTRNVTRSRSLGTKLKPKPVLSSGPETKVDGSDRKTMEKPLPNYLKPTISSRPNPVKLTTKNKAVEDNQNLLRRRSCDRPPSSLTSKSTSHTSPACPREKPLVPRESKRVGLRGSSTVKPHPVASRGSPGAKTSSLSSSSSSKSKKERSETVPKKYLGEITPESSLLVAPDHEDEEEIVKVETDVQVSDYREEEPKEEVARPDESHPQDASIEEVKEELINEDKTEEQIEEPKESENTQDNNTEDIDDEDNSETVAQESKAEEEEKAKDEQSESKEGTTETENLPEEETKKEVVQGKKVSKAVYNDVIASKMQENSKKNKVLALAGAFQTVIDYETAKSK